MTFGSSGKLLGQQRVRDYIRVQWLSARRTRIREAAGVLTAGAASDTFLDPEEFDFRVAGARVTADAQKGHLDDASVHLKCSDSALVVQCAVGRYEPVLTTSLYCDC